MPVVADDNPQLAILEPRYREFDVGESGGNQQRVVSPAPEAHLDAVRQDAYLRRGAHEAVEQLLRLGLLVAVPDAGGQHAVQRGPHEGELEVDIDAQGQDLAGAGELGALDEAGEVEFKEGGQEEEEAAKDGVEGVGLEIEGLASASCARLSACATASCRPALSPSRPEAVVLKYLDRYRDGLFGHPVARVPAGRVLAVVERTNNGAEHLFAIAKQKLRGRLGRAHPGRDMEDEPAQATLAANLLCPEYVRIVCGTLDRLPQAFAKLDRKRITAATPLQRNNRGPALRKHIRAWEAAVDD